MHGFAVVVLGRRCSDLPRSGDSFAACAGAGLSAGAGLYSRAALCHRTGRSAGAGGGASTAGNAGCGDGKGGCKPAGAGTIWSSGRDTLGPFL